MRRMTEMQYMMSAMKGDSEDNPFLNHFESVINGNHPLVSQKILSETDPEKQKEVADYLFKLALLDQHMLQGEGLHEFVKKSLERV